MKFQKIYPTILLTFVFVVGCIPKETVQHYETRSAYDIISELSLKIQSGDYKEVEDYFESLVTKKTYSINGTRLLEEIYVGLSKRRDIIKYLDDWCSLKESKNSAFIVRGNYYINHAWRARGGDWGYAVTDEARKIFRERLLLAKQDLESAYNLNPHDPNSASLMITVCMGLGLSEMTMDKWFRNAIKADPLTLLPYRNKLLFLLPRWHGSKKKAESFAEYCYSSPPKGSVVYAAMFDLIHEYAKRSHDKRAFLNQKDVISHLNHIFDRWLKEFPNSTLARTNKAAIHYFLGEKQTAIDYCSEAIKIDPNNYIALHNRAVYYREYFNETGHKKAENDYKKLILIDPFDDIAFFRLGTMHSYFYNDNEQAIEYYDKAIILNNKEKEYFLHRGIAKLTTRDYGSALTDFNTAISLDNRYIRGYLNRGLSFLRLKRFKEAEVDFHKASGLIEREMGRGDLASIAPEEAERLRKQINNLLPQCLTSVKPEMAEQLSKKQGWLMLNAVEILSPEVARQLAKHKGPLDLNGLKTISSEVAQELGKHSGDMRLNGLTSITAEVAENLALIRGTLDLNGIASITPEAAEQLIRHHQTIRLDYLKTMTPEVAVHLGKREGGIFLNGLTSLSLDVAENLGTHRGLLALNGLKTIEPGVAAHLTKNKGHLFLNGLTSISEETAGLLAEHRGGLSLNGLRSLTPEIALQLSKHKGYINLGGLSSITPEILDILRVHDGSIHMNGLKHVTENAMEYFAKCDNLKAPRIIKTK